ncbi:hypothetical protein ACP4OV_011151 [Aristida adscensionis]
MAVCSRAAAMSRLCCVVAMQPRDLWSLVTRCLPKLLDLSRSLLKRLRKCEHFGSPWMDSRSVVGTMPELPQDMLMSIFAALEIPDLVRAGSVCSSWHAAYTSLRNLGRYRESQTPCLLYTSESAGENVACLYSLAEQRVYKFTLPEPPIRSRFLIGSSNGWLITADERSELHLVNPITTEQIALPSVITIEEVNPIFDASGTIHKYELSYYSRNEEGLEEPETIALSDLREYLYLKAFVFPDLSTGSYIVVIIHRPCNQLSFARPGDYKWTCLSHKYHYTDCVFMDGLLYAVTSLGEVHAFDLTSTNVTMTVIIGELKRGIYELMYIVQAPWGDLMQVWMTRDICRLVDDPSVPSVRIRKITVYKVDIVAKELVEINNLPDHMLFLGHTNSLCLSAEYHPQLKANCVYYTDDWFELIRHFKNEAREIGVFDMENSSKAEIVPPVWSNWPSPTWITLNLGRMNLAFSK